MNFYDYNNFYLCFPCHFEKVLLKYKYSKKLFSKGKLIILPSTVNRTIFEKLQTVYYIQKWLIHGSSFGSLEWLINTVSRHSNCAWE